MTTPPGHEIYNFGRPSLGHYNYILTLFNLWLGVFLIEIMHFHYITFMTTPLHKNPCPEGHEIYNFGRHFFGHHNYTLCLFTVNFTECDLMLRITTLLVFFKSISRLSETDDVVYTMLIINTPCMRYYDVSHIAPYTLYLFQNETYKYYS